MFLHLLRIHPNWDQQRYNEIEVENILGNTTHGDNKTKTQRLLIFGTHFTYICFQNTQITICETPQCTNTNSKIVIGCKTKKESKDHLD